MEVNILVLRHNKNLFYKKAADYFEKEKGRNNALKRLLQTKKTKPILRVLFERVLVNEIKNLFEIVGCKNQPHIC